jgi:hypothetical protein
MSQTTPTTIPAGPFNDIEQVRAANKRLGHHWFDADTLRWFNSRVGGTLYGGRYFVSSERGFDRQIWGGTRRYSVRRANPNGSISTVGDFGQFATLKQAQAAAISYSVFGEPTFEKEVN